MATMTGALQFTGSLGEFSAYKRKGSDKIVVRRKGGPTKKQVTTGQNFDLTRRNNKEFGGRSKAAAALRRILYPLKHTADHDFSGKLNALMNVVQKRDMESILGQRNVLLSACRSLPAGFSLNTNQLFNAVVTAPVNVTISRKTGTAVIELPALLPGLNFIHAYKAPFARFTAVLGVVPDLVFNSSRNQYLPIEAEGSRQHQVVHTAWWAARNNYDGEKLILQLNEALHESHTIVLALGIEFGSVLTGDRVQTLKGAGCTRIMATA